MTIGELLIYLVTSTDHHMLTVFMATHNGADWIRRCLSSFCEMDTPVGGYKLVIIDNASTDETSSIIDSFKNRLPICHLREEIAGKNRALNRGLEYLEGDLAIFTDDDVIVPHDWLTNFLALSLHKSEYAIFGGRILPLWPQTPTASLLEAIPLSVTYAIHPVNLKDGPVAPNAIWGANMAVRASLFEAGNRFEDSVGPSQGNYIMGSETEFTTRMTDLGHFCWFANDITVQHIIRPNQLTTDWIAGRAQRYGRRCARGVLSQRQGKDTAFISRLLNGLKDSRVKPMSQAIVYQSLGRLLSNDTLYLKGLWNFNLNSSTAKELRALKHKQIDEDRTIKTDP